MTIIMPEDEIRLSEIYERLRLLVGQPDTERAGEEAEAFLLEAAEICGVPADLLDAYRTVKRWYA
jgi:hypothetical protein